MRRYYHSPRDMRPALSRYIVNFRHIIGLVFVMLDCSKGDQASIILTGSYGMSK